MSFKLHPQLEADTWPVTRLDLNEVLLVNDSRYLWCILVPRLPGLRDFHDVPVADKPQMQREVDRLSAVVQELDSSYKINVAALGNMVEQLHVHVNARQVDDAAWPGPVWGVGSAIPYTNEAAHVLVKQLRDALTAPS